MRNRSIALCAILVAAGLAAAAYHVFSGRAAAPFPAAGPGSGDRIESFCSSCHRFPPPDTLPRWKWEEVVESMYAMIGLTKDAVPASVPPMDDVIRFYTKHAPERLPPIVSTAGVGPGPLDLERIPLKLAGLEPFPGVANARFVPLHEDRRLDLLLSEMRFSSIFVARPYLGVEKIGLVARVPHPCHAEVVDLDRDGIRDLLVADLGTVTPSDALEGAVLWLRGTPGGGFETRPIATGLGRVSDAQAADFDGDGDLDIVAAVFGWRAVGEILYFENRTTDHAAPAFERSVLDPRAGAIQVPVADLDKDGRPDFVALIAQHHETVVAFLNRGGGRFEQRPLFEAGHPTWGGSGIELVDLDGDDDLDVLLANGDSLDDLVLKPYHGIGWLENRGGYPFVHHRITDLHGVHRAKAGDLDQDGDLDIAACAFLPFVTPGTPGADLVDSIIWLEQTSPGEFRRWSIESGRAIHPTLDVGDYDGDGDADIVVGNMTMAQGRENPIDDWVILFRNRRRD